jgi:hypothetical protein
MKNWRSPFIAVVLLSLLATFSRSSDAGTDLTTEPPFKSRTEVRQRGAVTVRAAVLTDDESERYFGASLADHGIQVVWLNVDNASDLRLRFLPIITDPNYFSAPEVERLLRVWWRSGSANASIASVIAQSPVPDVIAQKRTAAGFVFTHREGGLKLLEVGFETELRLEPAKERRKVMVDPGWRRTRSDLSWLAAAETAICKLYALLARCGMSRFSLQSTRLPRRVSARRASENP